VKKGSDNDQCVVNVMSKSDGRAVIKNEMINGQSMWRQQTVYVETAISGDDDHRNDEQCVTMCHDV